MIAAPTPDSVSASNDAHVNGAPTVQIEPVEHPEGVFKNPPFSLFWQDRWIQLAILATVVAYALSTQPVHRVAGYNTFWDGWEYNIAFTLPIIPMLRRANRSQSQRVAWRLLALGVVLNTAATLVYTYHDQNLVPIPSPALSDAFYLASYALFIAGVAILTQSRLGRVHASVRLDGAIAGLAMASLAGMLWFEPLLKVSGHPLQIIVGMAYPLTDLVLLVLLIAGLAPNRYRPNWSTAFLMAGVLCWVIGDVIYLKQQAAGTYVQSTILDCTWPFGVFLMGLAASTDDRRRSRDLRAAESATYDITLMPVGAGLLSIVVLAFFFGRHDSSLIVISLALGSLILVIARMWLTLGEERQLVRESDKDARTDALTGLPNRRSFFEDFELNFGALGTDTVGVILIDPDGFKDVNDTLGHLIGDDLLRVVSRRFESCLDERGIMARLGGDEFAFAARVGDESAITKIARELVAALSDPCVLDGVSVRVGASAGVALTSTGETIAELLRAADVAMYDAKRLRTGVSIYRAVNDPNSREQLELVGALHEAIESRALTLNFQPTLDLATGEICGVEALARWRHEQLGSVAPDVFIPIAENAGLMPELTRLVLEMAVDKAAHIDTTGRTINMSVNISRLDLLDDELPAFIERLLAKYGYPAQRLTLEITETTLSSDPEQTAQSIQRLRILGVRISIDDYGVGYSSMSQLLGLEIDELKVDKSFLIQLSSDERAQAIVRSATELAHALGLRLVTEGIEEGAVLDLVRRLGADIGQGYYIATPMTSDQLDEFLSRPAIGQILLAESVRPATTTR
jgi:diguanylate cyclase (GGDEF)-like protein